MMNKKLKKRLFRVGVLTAVLHGVNQFLFHFAIKKQILYRYQGKYFQTKFGDMFYHIYGNKESDQVLLLLHDLTASSSGYEWNKMIAQLSKDYKIYVLDLLGCGRSNKPEIDYTPYLYIQLIKLFLDETIGAPVNIVATGKTASIMTQLIAMENNPLIKKVIAINPEITDHITYEKNYKNKLIKNIIDLPILGTFLYNMNTSKNLIEEKFEEVYFCNPNRIRNRYIDAYYESAHLSRASSRFLFSSIQAHYLDMDIERSLEKMKDNYIILVGECFKNSNKLIKLCNRLNHQIKIEKCKETSFLPQLERPDAVSQLINDFIKE